MRSRLPLVPSTNGIRWSESDRNHLTLLIGLLTLQLVLSACTQTADRSPSPVEPEARPQTSRLTGPDNWDRVIRDTMIVGDLVVPDGRSWLIGPNVRVRGNVRTHNGTIAMRPGSSIQLLGADPKKYVGGGMHYAPQFAKDIGIWVGAGHGARGRLDIACTPKAGWNRTGTDPSWSPGDEYWVAPTAPGDFSPRRWYPGQPVPRVSPLVPPTEVFNITRDCSITGPGHIFVHSTVPQRIEYVTLREMGVEIKNRDSGRYAIHLHHGGNGMRGTVIRGVAAINSRGRVFVPHASHGVTLVDNIAVNSWGNVLWWDMNSAQDRTNDLVVERLGVTGVHYPRSESGSTSQVSAVALPGGTNLTLRNSAVSGASGSKISHGFSWPEKTSVGGESPWTFDQGNVAHNNQGAGVRLWMNNSHPHSVSGTRTYRNGQGGVENGAYANAHRFADIVMVDDWLEQHASGRNAAGTQDPASFRRITVHSSDGSAIRIGQLRLPAGTRTLFEDCVLTVSPGHKKVALHRSAVNPFLAIFRRCGITPQDIAWPSPMPVGLRGSYVTIEHEDGRTWDIRVRLDGRISVSLR